MNRTTQLIIYFAILAFILALLIFFGYQFMDPFSRDITIATLPFEMVFYLLSAILFVAFHRIFYGGGGLGFLESKLVKAKEINIRFADVVGMEEAVMEAKEVVQMVKDRIKARQGGGHIIRGLLMMGPPGCGKTMLAKAIATEAGLPFLALSGSDFVEKWHALGAMRIRGLFREARRLAEDRGACVVFIDELEVIGRKRNFSAQQGEAETNRTLTQLLVEMDGLSESAQSNIIVIGATNAEENVLDSALLRPGRFDRKLRVDLPTREGRAELFSYYLGKTKSQEGIDVKPLAYLTHGKSPADIENITREAALMAAKKNKKAYDFGDLIEAIEKLDIGMRARIKLKEKERSSMAFHEAGRLIAAARYEPRDEIVRISIAPRKRKFTVIQQIPTEERHRMTRDDFLNQIRIRLAGYVAEQLIHGQTSELARNYLDEVSYMAQEMVWRVGMGKSGCLVSYGAVNPDLVADQTRRTLNGDYQSIIFESIEEVRQLMSKQRPLLEEIARQLMERDELDRAQIEGMIGHLRHTAARKLHVS